MPCSLAFTALSAGDTARAMAAGKLANNHKAKVGPLIETDLFCANFHFANSRQIFACSKCSLATKLQPLQRANLQTHMHSLAIHGGNLSVGQFGGGKINKL